VKEFTYCEAEIEAPPGMERRIKCHKLNRILYDIWALEHDNEEVLNDWFKRKIKTGPYAHFFIKDFLDFESNTLVLRCLPEKVEKVRKRLAMFAIYPTFKEIKVSLDVEKIQELCADVNYKFFTKKELEIPRFNPFSLIDGDLVNSNKDRSKILPVTGKKIFIDRSVLNPFKPLQPFLKVETFEEIRVRQFSCIVVKIISVDEEMLKQSLINGVGGKRSYGCGLVSLVNKED